MVIKTRTHDEFISNLEEIFNSLRKFRWKLNPTKCVFIVPQGKLFGFIVSHQGITAITDGGSADDQECLEAHMKLLYAILITSKKLHHYFDVYKILVVIDFHWWIYSTIRMPLDASPSG
jgi:hypothetical protein